MKLSIITINHNNVNGLYMTLESVAYQTFSDYEQIIIDGGSNDESLLIIQKFSRLAAQNFKWQSEPDSGIYNAMNKGIRLASGEYCLFLNSGDYLNDEKVLERVFAQNPEADVVFGNLVVVNEGKLKGIIKGKQNISFLDVYSSLIKHQASFIKRDLFDKIGSYDESLKIVADWALFLKEVAYNDASTQYLDIDITCYDNNGFSSSHPELCASERQRVLNEYMPKLMQKDYLLLQKYQGIQWINQSKWAWFLFRVLVKLVKIIFKIK